jgi:hypothetical protein
MRPSFCIRRLVVLVAQPSHFQRFGIVVVVCFCFLAAANFAWLLHQFPVTDGVTNCVFGCVSFRVFFFIPPVCLGDSSGMCFVIRPYIRQPMGKFPPFTVIRLDCRQIQFPMAKNVSLGTLNAFA